MAKIKKRALTPAQEFLRQARLLRSRCAREINEMRRAGCRINVPHLARKYERTEQCIYQWIKWAETHKEEAA